MKTFMGKVGLATEIWVAYLRIVVLLRRRPLHDVAEALNKPRGRARSVEVAPRYSRAIHRVLKIGNKRPRCLPSALVLFRLLNKRGLPAELVVGLPSSPLSHIAHAWVELDGRDVGPPPGRHDHEGIARYGLRRARSDT